MPIICLHFPQQKQSLLYMCDLYDLTHTLLQIFRQKMPSRQKSMIDLREPYWDGPRHKVHPVQVGRIPPGGGSATQPPRGGGGPMPGLVRSATEHDIRLRSRRPGPGMEGRGVPSHYQDLPPHIRQHMVNEGVVHCRIELSC